MAGQQREFVVVVKDRRAHARVVIGKAKPLRHLFVHTAEPDQIGMFGAHKRNRLVIGVRASGRRGRNDKAIDRPWQVAEDVERVLGHIRDEHPKFINKLVFVILAHKQDVEIGTHGRHRDWMPCDTRQPFGIGSDHLAVT